MHAIAKHDSAYATAGQGLRNNNIGNLRCMNSNRDIVSSKFVQDTNYSTAYFAKFDTVEDSIWSLVSLYTRKYAGQSPEDITRVYAGNPQSGGYWKAINSCYN